MLFQRPYISKTLGGACLRTPVAARAFGARDCPPPNPPNPPNKSNLATALHKEMKKSLDTKQQQIP